MLTQVRVQIRAQNPAITTAVKTVQLTPSRDIRSVAMTQWH